MLWHEVAELFCDILVIAVADVHRKVLVSFPVAFASCIAKWQKVLVSQVRRMQFANTVAVGHDCFSAHYWLPRLLGSILFGIAGLSNRQRRDHPLVALIRTGPVLLDG